MDEELTGGYREPCGQCGCVAWAVSDEGRFFCRLCHNVIERTHQVEVLTCAPGSSQISTISQGSRAKRPERVCRWVACEGFQFILMRQAAALIDLGVAPSFKDDVLWPLWRRFLQMSRQAYTNNPVRSAKFKVQAVDSEPGSAAESSCLSASETDGEMWPSDRSPSQAGSHSDWSTGSQGSCASPRPRRKWQRGAMSMAKTLALIHVALVWSRQALTLSDLLRLANDGAVPYVHAYRDLPEEMKLDGAEALIFTVQSIPTYRALHREAQTLVGFLQLPAFPRIRRQDPLHPAMLGLRYLADANLPDELHPWLYELMERSGMADVTCGPSEASSRPVLPQYDVRTAALAVVTLKLLFGLDDHTEWDLSNAASDLVTGKQAARGHPGTVFSLRRWYRLLHAAKLRKQRARDSATARKQWKATPLYPSRKLKSVVLKKRRVAEQLALCLEKFSRGGAPRAPPAAPSSLTFCWGTADGADGPSLRDSNLDAAVTQKGQVLTPVNTVYWHPQLATCNSRKCGSLCAAAAVEATLPRSFLWLLQFFSFLLQVSPTHLHQEVMNIERRVFATKAAQANRTELI
ncbi:TATA box-binding protein-associated factor RNA polymerase I subunit B isoform X1 [Hippocampus zosterae]|uniref:TATA box-binding protein-associated factor RNA polymerase I subunit B isoform X1 n=2 Tax=Hippocampus zosterae TaxID=109293 RepID=UPI00223CFE7F|nr:TATA box-binding protein-associated factor RNA polymerase I subunit B isoform X1 [Hippocampus zosterae]